MAINYSLDLAAAQKDEYIYYYNRVNSLSYLNMFREKEQQIVQAIQRSLLGNIVVTGQLISPQSVDKAASGLRVVSELDSGTLFQALDPEFFSFVDQIITETLSDRSDGGISLGVKVQANIDSARKYSNLFQNGKDDISRINSFFHLVILAMNEAGMLDVNVLNALTGLGTRLIGTEFYNSISTDKIFVNQSDIDAANKVITTLTRAVDKLEQNGSLSARSFAQTIARIFRNNIGDAVVKKTVQTALKVAAKTDRAFDNFVESIPELHWTTPPPKIDEYGDEIPVAPFVIGDTANGISIEATDANENTLKISIAYNGKIKWDTKKSKNISSINYNTIPIYHNFGKRYLDFFDRGIERWYVKNISVPHRGSYRDSLSEYSSDAPTKVIRNFIGASYFQEWADSVRVNRPGDYMWLPSSGNALVSVDYMLKKALEKELETGFANSVNIIGIENIVNPWHDTKDDPPDWQKAAARSYDVGEALGTITVTASFDSFTLAEAYGF